MSLRFRFAPVSSAQSSLLRLASGYFLLIGVFYGLVVALLLVGYFRGEEVSASPTLEGFSVVTQTIVAAGLAWTGWLIGRGARLGGFLALGFLILPLAFTTINRQPMDMTEVVFGGLGLIVVTAIWHELK